MDLKPGKTGFVGLCGPVASLPIGEDDAWVQVELAWLPTSQEAAVGRFVAFLRDEARSRGLF